MNDDSPRSRGWRTVSLAGLAALAVACGGGGGGSGSFPTAQDLASVRDNPQHAARVSGAGDFAADYLRGTNFTSIVIEIDYVASRPPDPAAVDLLAQRVAERCDKPDGVVAIVDDAIPDDQFGSVTSLSRLDAIEHTYRDNYADAASGVAVMYFLYAAGQSDLGGGPTDILAITYHGSSVALYVDVADQGSDPFVTSAEVEGAGIVHEAGHLMGLTNGTVPMLEDHQDRPHGSHDSYPSSVMYWLVQVPETTPNLGDADFADFDARSVADLQAFGGMGPLSIRGPLSILATPLGRLGPVRAAGEMRAVGRCAHCAGCMPPASGAASR